MTEQASKAGLEFLAALEEYLEWRIDEKGAVPLAYAEKFGNYLKMLGATPGEDPYDVLTDYMKKMAEARGRKPPDGTPR